MNFGRQNARGLDIGVDVFATNQVKLRGNLSFVEAGTLTDAAGSEQPFNTPRFKYGMAALVSDWPVSNAFVDVSLRHVDGHDYQEGVHIGRIPAYNIVDLNVGYKTRSRLTFKLSVQNVFDNGHIEIPDGPPIGRIAVSEVSYDF